MKIEKQNKNYLLNILGLLVYSSLQSVYCVGGTEVLQHLKHTA